MKALHIAATGMAAQQMRVDTVSNNLANMSTTGFNSRRVDFVDLAYQQLSAPGQISASDGTIVPTGIQLGLGVRSSGVSTILSQGALAQTGGDLDLAIEGRGYIEVTLPGGGSAYTRDGALKRSADGLIVTSEGFQVAPGITIPIDARSISISPEGEVFAYFADRTEAEALGLISLASFSNEKGLEAIGSNMFRETAASGQATQGRPGQDGMGVLRQGYLEESSVDAIREVTELIKAQRGYELNAKVITAADQILAATTQVR